MKYYDFKFIYMANQPVVVQQPGGDNGMGFVIGIILLIGFVIFLMYYGIPMIQRSTSGPQINVPDKVDVNIKQE